MPEECRGTIPERQQEARKAVRKFWVAATAGAFLSGLSRNIPADLATIAWPPDWCYTTDLFLRYGYMLWFLFYFAMSSFNTEQKTAKDNALGDLSYDVVQSIVALVAVFYLGFVNREKRIDPKIEYFSANAAIFVISGLSWFFFSFLPRRESTGSCFWLERISVLREFGILFSSLGVLFALLFVNSLHIEPGIYALFIALQVGLWVLLGCFWEIRWNHPEGDNDHFETERIHCWFWKKKV